MVAVVVQATELLKGNQIEVNKMEIKELEKQLENGNATFRGKCHDCGNPVEILCSINKEGKLVINGGAMYNPKIGTPPIEHTFYKCDLCFNKDNTLKNFVPCSVYSRVVGYIRPVSGWNKGKLEEFKQRKEFVVEKRN